MMKVREKKPPVAPIPYSDKGRMVDAVITFCNSCDEYALIKPTSPKFNKEMARKVAIDNKWRLLNGKWHCKKCVMARTVAPKEGDNAN